MSLGTLRVDELILPIVGLSLVRGGIRVQAKVSGPLESCSGNVRLFSGDGEPVTDGAHGASSVIVIPEVRDHSSVVVDYILSIDAICKRK